MAISRSSGRLGGVIFGCRLRADRWPKNGVSLAFMARKARCAPHRSLSRSLAAPDSGPRTNGLMAEIWTSHGFSDRLGCKTRSSPGPKQPTHLASKVVAGEGLSRFLRRLAAAASQAVCWSRWEEVGTLSVPAKPSGTSSVGSS